MEMEEEIFNEYKRMKVIPVVYKPFFNEYWALSQYGYVLMDGFSTEEEAKKYIINFYSQRMNLIRQ